MRASPSEREMRRAVARRDAGYDGVFVSAVKTTGVFCRPSCPARRPRPANVEFFPAARDALFAGYRPCKRCRPLEADGRPPDWVARLLAEIERAPDRRLRNADLRAAGVDPARARRFFQRHYGLTFQAFARARRLGDALALVRRGEDINRAALRIGYQSTSGFRDGFARLFGTPPGRARMNDCIYTAVFDSPVGPLLAGATGDAVCLLEFCDRRALEKQAAALRRRFGCPVVPGQSPLLRRLRAELAEYFDGRRKRFTLPLAYPGTPFQQRVWKALLDIPYGRTLSYEELARRAGAPGAQRAAGSANGANRIAIVIPCHRVVNKDGRLGGYGGGLWRKKMLLDLERASCGRVSRAV